MGRLALSGCRGGAGGRNGGRVAANVPVGFTVDKYAVIEMGHLVRRKSRRREGVSE